MTDEGVVVIAMLACAIAYDCAVFRLRKGKKERAK